ncbi:DUF6438 domain-containing protein [Tenacibaculum amylolyticum]|uniref:DUF6438 domain-containing protein n=1 Tax=Tenacibaculum amylolyticum TaxID=104269 RepID=UPI0038B49535
MKYWYVFMISIIIGCATSKQTTTPTIHYRKTACLGKCPVFDLYVYKDGNITYKGLNNVKIKGEQNFHITKQEVTYLEQEIAKLTINTSKVLVRDLPKTKITYNGKTITIQQTKQVPKFNALVQKLGILN